MNPHIDNLLRRCPQLDACRPEVEKTFAILRDCFQSGGKLLLCGNGGSAADAEHWAGELLKGFGQKRPLSPAEKQGLPEALGLKLQGALPVIPLTGFISLSTAFANDVDPNLIFAQLVWGLGRPGDVLVGDCDGVIVIPAELADEIADGAVEMTAYEDFVTERVRAGAGTLGLYPPTDEANLEAFAVWRRERGR